jgi:hypothetical protein
VGSHSMLEIKKWLQQFLNWWPETIELMEDQGHMTWKTVHQILHNNMGQEEDMHKVHCVQY